MLHVLLQVGYSIAMPANASKLISIVEEYFSELRRLRASGGATGELSTYPALSNLLNAVGATLRPKVFCVVELADQGAGHPDIGLYSARQVQRGKPRKGQSPERGVIEVKGPGDDAWLIAESDQVSDYWENYRLVLVTNTRDFVLLGEDLEGRSAKLETFSLADSANEFDTLLLKPRTFAKEVGAGFGEYLCRALSHPATIVEPRDLAWLMASYARDGLARVTASEGSNSLSPLRSALEDALGVRFEGERGAAFFRSTLVQTLFYGVFSAWVLWSRQSSPPTEKFNWRETAWHLRVPVIIELFQQLSNPSQLESLGLVEVLDWTADALDRVDRDTFFQRFDEGEAVQYFYEPFLEAFDPALKKQLGVWYTPLEVVRYMVARVDMALKDDLGIPEGLAAENVYVLDPCCGTGAYVSEVLRRIAYNLEGSGLGALTGSRVKQAATDRVFGFEIMPAPFVVAHLQVGLTMQDLDAPLSENETERAGIFLTNALTGWKPTVQKPLPFPGLEEERDRAERVKQDTPVLVILGNPPYNAYAGVAIQEERELFETYRATRSVRLQETKGLIDLYVRFFRMADRRIVEGTGQGVISFISNYSWLEGLSFAGMRERYLREFDAIRIDNLNGDKYRTGKVAPDGSPDPSIFSTPNDPVGIQVGTAITTLVRRVDHKPAETVEFRNLWGRAKGDELAETAELDLDSLYESIIPVLPLGLPFTPIAASDEWFEWPTIPDIFSTSFSGAKTNRDSFLVDIDLDKLRKRVADYFNTDMGHDVIAHRYPAVMKTARHFDAQSIRDTLTRRGGPSVEGFIRYAYRPFDDRWLYWEAETKLLNDKRADYKPHVFDGNMWIVSQRKPRRGWSPPQVISNLGCIDLMDRGATCIPAYLREEGLGFEGDEIQHRPNLSPAAETYLDRIGSDVEDLFHHVLAVLHDPAYREANAGALRMEWPRIPVPGWPEGDEAGASDELAESAARGGKLASLLDSGTPVLGVTSGALRPEIAVIAVPSSTDGGNMAGDDFDVTAGWGYFGSSEAVMPGQGRVVVRPYTREESKAMGDEVSTLGKTTYDVYLNERAYWRNVPENVWRYKLGGYQVLKKWLSYRESKVLGRSLLPDEVQHFAETSRRIAAILRLVSQRSN